MTSVFRKSSIMAIFAILFALLTAQAKEMEIVGWAPADQNERYRFEAVALAANILNEELKIEGRDIQVKVSSRSFAGSQTWQQLKQGFSLDVEAGTGRYIIVGGHEDIPVWGSWSDRTERGHRRFRGLAFLRYISQPVANHVMEWAGLGAFPRTLNRNLFSPGILT
jgi:hypothetical protein